MPRVSYQLIADSPIGAVLEPLPPLWTECHFSTRGVEGDAGHPARPGDRITGKVRIAGIKGTGTWVVVEHDRLCHLPLKPIWPPGRLRISYQLDTVAGAARVSGVT